MFIIIIIIIIIIIFFNIDLIASDTYAELTYGYIHTYIHTYADLGGSVGRAVRLKIRRLRVQSPPRAATFFRGD